MPRIQCPVNGCMWQSQDLEAAFADVLTEALRIHDRATHCTGTGMPQTVSMVKPSIGIGCEPDLWSVFVKEWNIYKTGLCIPSHVISTVLFQCCDQDLRTAILKDVGRQHDIVSMPEGKLLNIIKQLALDAKQIMARRLELSKMVQTPGLTVDVFYKNLVAQAALCHYTVKCPNSECEHEVDYSVEIIKDNLIRGIADPEIRTAIIAECADQRSTQGIVDFVAKKEKEQFSNSESGCSFGDVVPTIVEGSGVVTSEIAPQSQNASLSLSMSRHKREPESFDQEYTVEHDPPRRSQRTCSQCGEALQRNAHRYFRGHVYCIKTALLPYKDWVNNCTGSKKKYKRRGAPIKCHQCGEVRDKETHRHFKGRIYCEKTALLPYDDWLKTLDRKYATRSGQIKCRECGEVRNKETHRHFNGHVYCENTANLSYEDWVNGLIKY